MVVIRPRWPRAPAGANEMNMRVEAPAVTIKPSPQSPRGDADDQVLRHARHHVGIAGFADAGNQAVFDAQVSFVNPV